MPKVILPKDKQALVKHKALEGHRDAECCMQTDLHCSWVLVTEKTWLQRHQNHPFALFAIPTITHLISDLLFTMHCLRLQMKLWQLSEFRASCIEAGGYNLVLNTKKPKARNKAVSQKKNVFRPGKQPPRPCSLPLILWQKPW